MKDFKLELGRILGFIREQVAGAQAKGVVLGISGGIDSALVGKLCVMALGDDNVQGLFLPADKDVNPDSRQVAKYLHIYTNTIPIGKMCQEMAMLTGALDQIPYGNIKARMRMVCLYAHANKNNMLVAGTGNRSEILTGYFTKYGDGGCDILPIGDLYKTEVWQLSADIGLPTNIINKVPSAELWEGQTDEDELGVGYEKLDRLLYFLEDLNFDYYLKNLGTVALSTMTTEEEVRKVLTLMIKAQHKLKMPPMPKEG